MSLTTISNRHGFKVVGRVALEQNDYEFELSDNRFLRYPKSIRVGTKTLKVFRSAPNKLDYADWDQYKNFSIQIELLITRTEFVYVAYNIGESTNYGLKRIGFFPQESFDIEEHVKTVEQALRQNHVQASKTTNLLASIMLMVSSGRASALRDLLRSSKDAVHVVQRESGRLVRTAQRAGDREIVSILNSSANQGVTNYGLPEITTIKQEKSREDKDFEKDIFSDDASKIKRAMRERANDFVAYRSSDNGETALTFHSRNGNLENVKTLLESGEYTSYQIEQRNANGETALQLAEKSGNKQLVKLLKQYDAVE
jgi:hypothetical protein